MLTFFVWDFLLARRLLAIVSKCSKCSFICFIKFPIEDELGNYSSLFQRTDLNI